MLADTNRAVEYRHIITRAVCGKGRKFSHVTHHIQSPNDIHTILGAWVINHHHEPGAKVGEAVEVSGSYDINIWYSTRGNTKTDVVKQKVEYTEIVPLSYCDPNTYEATARVSSSVAQAPNCVEASISSTNDGVTVRVEKEFAVEMVGDTKICVAVHPYELAEYDEKELISGYSEMDSHHFDDLDPDLVIDDLDD